MVDCDTLRPNLPLLLTESLDADSRERTHQHIERCAACSAEWNELRETWQILAALPVVEVPGRARSRFLAEIQPAALQPNVVPFRRRPVTRWLAQAAGLTIIAGGSWFAGHHQKSSPTFTPATSAAVLSAAPARIESVTPVSQVKYSIAESQVLDAGQLNQNIEGRPDIQNVSFIDPNPQDDTIGVSFDVTQHVTVNGRPTDKSMVRLLSYVLENENSAMPSRAKAIDWIRAKYSDSAKSDPEIARALASVLRKDTHEGVRIKAVETMNTLPAMSASPETRQALIEALKSDPNPAVRLKAVEALANLAKNGGTFDSATLDTLRQKATQDNENLYVRVKAAEALSNIHQ